MLKLLGRPNSLNVRKVLWLCDELGLALEFELWGAGHRSVQAPEFLALNPNALVPVLVDDGAVLWESNTICRYLAARQGRTDLLPRAALERARVEQWMDWQLGDLNTAWRAVFMGRVRHDPAYQDPQMQADSAHAWARHMGILDAQLQRTGAFASGADFTLADLGLGLATQRWFMTPLERPELPAVAAYYERLSARPGFMRHGRNGLP